MLDIQFVVAEPSDNIDIQNFAFLPANRHLRSLSLDEVDEIIDSGTYFLAVDVSNPSSRKIAGQCYCLESYDDSTDTIEFELGGILIKDSTYSKCNLAYHLCVAAMARVITLNNFKKSFYAHVLKGNSNPNSLLNKLGFNYESTKSYQAGEISGIAHMVEQGASVVQADIFRLPESEIVNILEQNQRIPIMLPDRATQRLKIEIHIPGHRRGNINDAIRINQG